MIVRNEKKVRKVEINNVSLLSPSWSGNEFDRILCLETFFCAGNANVGRKRMSQII